MIEELSNATDFVKEYENRLRPAARALLHNSLRNLAAARVGRR